MECSDKLLIGLLRVIPDSGHGPWPFTGKRCHMVSRFLHGVPMFYFSLFRANPRVSGPTFIGTVLLV